MRSKIDHTLAEARQRHAVHGQRLVLVVAVLAYGKAHEHELAHVPQDVKRQTERLFPNRVEAVVLDRARAVRYLERRRACRRRVEAPIGEMQRDLDVWVESRLVDDLATVRVFRERKLLGRNNLDVPTCIRVRGIRGMGRARTVIFR